MTNELRVRAAGRTIMGNQDTEKQMKEMRASMKAVIAKLDALKKANSGIVARIERFILTLYLK
jgi:hypothetical protein